MGERVPTDAALKTEWVVYVTVTASQSGPVADSVLLVAVSQDGNASARYLSWIVGYEDLDRASGAESGRWRLIEPATPYVEKVSWQPFGWGALEPVWTHARSSSRGESH